MALRDDVRWLIDGADMILAGGLPSWPREWTTKEGAKLRDLLVKLAERRLEDYGRRTTAEHGMRQAMRDEDAARSANEMLTDRVEYLEKTRTGKR